MQQEVLENADHQMLMNQQALQAMHLSSMGSMGSHQSLEEEVSPHQQAQMMQQLAMQQQQQLALQQLAMQQQMSSQGLMMQGDPRMMLVDSSSNVSPQGSDMNISANSYGQRMDRGLSTKQLQMNHQTEMTGRPRYLNNQPQRFPMRRNNNGMNQNQNRFPMSRRFNRSPTGNSQQRYQQNGRYPPNQQQRRYNSSDNYNNAYREDYTQNGGYRRRDNRHTEVSDTNVYIANFPVTWGLYELEKNFSQIGEIFRTSIAALSNNTRIAFVNFNEPECATKAIETFNGMSFKKRVLTVKHAFVKHDDRPSNRREEGDERTRNYGNRFPRNNFTSRNRSSNSGSPKNVKRTKTRSNDAKSPSSRASRNSDSPDEVKNLETPGKMVLPGKTVSLVDDKSVSPKTPVNTEPVQIAVN